MPCRSLVIAAILGFFGQASNKCIVVARPKKKGGLCGLPFSESSKFNVLPAEFDHHLQYAVANCVCSVPEIGLCKSPATVKREVQVLVTVEERPVRVVQEIIAGEAELKLSVLRFAKSEILEQRQVSVKEPRARQRWENVVALLARRNEWREASAIDVLVRLEAASRIAGKCGHQGDIRGTERILAASLDRDRKRRSHKCRTGLNETSVVKVRADRSLQICAGLVLADARDLPAVCQLFHKPVGIGHFRELIHICHVENVGAIVRNRSVVVSENRRIASG